MPLFSNIGIFNQQPTAQTSVPSFSGGQMTAPQQPQQKSGGGGGNSFDTAGLLASMLNNKTGASNSEILGNYGKDYLTQQMGGEETVNGIANTGSAIYNGVSNL